ncbi:hypothetical protein CPB97_002534 [Podila verticillata]|nr:hypothetical protein CPB97_002534 [Podila verticillata]
MEHINKICKEQEYPIEVENSPTLGNHAVAARDIPRGEGLLRAIPYAAEVFDNYKKRLCHVCLLYHGRGSFQLRCQDCDQVYFCSAVCRDIAMGSSSSSSTEPVNSDQDTQDTNPLTLNTTGYHAKVCRTLRKLATWNSDRHSKSIIKLLLHVLLNHWKERQGIPTTYRAHRMLEKERERRKGQPIHQEGDGIEALTQALESGAQLHEEASTESLATHGVKDAQDEIQEPIENDFFDVMRLQSHFEDWDEDDNKDWNRQAQVVLALLERSGLTEIAVAQGSLELRTLTAQDVKRMISALESNAFGMFDRSKSKPICFGRAIYPIASFFNHSCDENSTAVQADGSEEKVTSEDVLCVLGAEDEAKQNKIAKKKGAAKTKKKKAGSLESDGAPSTPLPSSSPAPTPPSFSPPLPGTVGEAEFGNEASPISFEGEESALEPSSEPDPYDTRVGEFRMMTFFAVKDIPKGQDITISYIDTEMPLQARRLALLSDYHFHCCCERCVREEMATAPGFNKKGSKEKDNKKKGGGGKKGRK